VIECAAEDIAVKRSVLDVAARFSRRTAVVSSTTSSMPLGVLADGRSLEFRRRFLGVHFFNPPTKMLLCELAPTSDTSPAVASHMASFLSQRLGRVVVHVRNVPGYAGNRVGFRVMNMAALLVEHLGVAVVDQACGPWTGRAMPPLATLDLVGLDVYCAIMASLRRSTSQDISDVLSVPRYVQDLVRAGRLGAKAAGLGGIYRRSTTGVEEVWEVGEGRYAPAIRPVSPFVRCAVSLIRNGRVQRAFELLMDDGSREADVARRFLATYVAYSYACIGTVTDQALGISGIDLAMVHGFGWAPPSLLLGLMGGAGAIIQLCSRDGIACPAHLAAAAPTLWHPSYGRYFRAIGD